MAFGGIFGDGCRIAKEVGDASDRGLTIWVRFEQPGLQTPKMPGKEYHGVVMRLGWGFGLRSGLGLGFWFHLVWWWEGVEAAGASAL